MEFEIKHKVDFEVGELAAQALDVVEDYFVDREPNYGELDNKQKDELLKAIFNRALEFLKEED